MDPYGGGMIPFAYWEQDPPATTHCPSCRSPRDFKAVSRHIRVRGRLDVYDAYGHIIVSQRFRDFCDRSGFADLEFLVVDRARGLFELRPTRILEVDVHRSELCFDRFCTTCGNFTDYGAGRGVFLHDITEPLADGIYRTDLLVGCGSGKWFRTIVAPVTRQRILDSGFKRIQFRALPDIDPHFDEYKQWSLGVRERLQNSARRYAEEEARMAEAGETDDDLEIIYPKKARPVVEKRVNGNGKHGRSKKKPSRPSH